MTERLPLFPLSTVLFPGQLLPLHVFEPRYRLLLSRRAGDDPSFGIVLIRSGGEVDDQPDTFDIGTSVVVRERLEHPDGRSSLIVEGQRRFQILESDWTESYMAGTVRWLAPPDTPPVPVELDTSISRISTLALRFLEVVSGVTGHQFILRVPDADPVDFAYTVATTVPLPIATRQSLLERATTEQLLSALEEALRHELALLMQTGAIDALAGHVKGRFEVN